MKDKKHTGNVVRQIEWGTNKPPQVTLSLRVLE